MIKITKQDYRLLLIYQPDRFNDACWLDDKLQQNGEVNIIEMMKRQMASTTQTQNRSGA